MKAIIFCGIQAAGKTTFFLEHFFHTHVRINLDMLRTRHRERLLLEACLEMKQPFVVDNTNPSAADRARYIEPARAARFEVIGYYFQSHFEASVSRNKLRAEARQVPEKGIRGTYARLELPRLEEGFDELLYVRIEEDGFVVEPWKGESS